eukprot:6541723-Prymnesium_polylepis.1
MEAEQGGVCGEVSRAGAVPPAPRVPSHQYGQYNDAHEPPLQLACAHGSEQECRVRGGAARALLARASCAKSATAANKSAVAARASCGKVPIVVRDGDGGDGVAKVGDQLRRARPLLALQLRRRLARRSLARGALAREERDEPIARRRLLSALGDKRLLLLLVEVHHARKKLAVVLGVFALQGLRRWRESARG